MYIDIINKLLSNYYKLIDFNYYVFCIITNTK